MIALALDLAVVFVIAFCGWRGYKNGLIRGTFGVVTLIASLFLASVAATAYSKEFTEILTPFVGGIVDSALIDIIDESLEGETDIPENDSYNYSISYAALRRIGLPESSSERVAALAVDGSENDKIPAVLLSDMISEKLSSTLSYVAVFGIAFILLAIVFTVIGNLVGVAFSLPGLKLVDIIAGTLFGIMKGLLLVYALAVIVRYAGLLAPDTLASTTLLEKIVNNNPVAARIGI